MPKRSARDDQQSKCDGGKEDSLDAGSHSTAEDGRKRRCVEKNKRGPEASNQGHSAHTTNQDNAMPGDFTEVDASVVTDSKPITETHDQEGESRADPVFVRYSEEELEKYDRYKMNHGKRGIALIFNHENFKNKTKKRDGAAADGRALSDTLRGLGFDVQVHNDKKLEDMWIVINEVAKMDHTRHDCLLVAFMTHGEDNGILHAYDHIFKTDEVFERFKTNRVPSLAGKPKIFLFQACRGTRQEESVQTLSSRSVDTTDSAPVRSFKLPSSADFLFLYSSMEGHSSWRHPEKGSWFIQDLCTELNKDARTKDILSIVTNTLRRVAHTRFSFMPTRSDMNKRQQMPIFSSTLTKFLYFD